MRRSERQSFSGKTDALRMFALGRVPRCGRCPRYRALSVAEPNRQDRQLASLPAVPEFCTYQLCAPLVTRYAGWVAPERSTSPLHGLRMAGDRR
jgi:hypothetical protein